MHTYPLGEYMRYIDVGDWDSVADLMLSSEAKLAKAGADLIICPDNTIHQAFDRVIEKALLPWLHIAEVVAEEAARQNYRRAGLLGTLYLMEGPVYSSKLARRGIEYLTPNHDERQRANHIIFNDLVNGRFTKESQEYLITVIERLKNQGCDSVILGCTEIPLVINPKNSPLPVVDSTRLLAQKALEHSIGKSCSTMWR
jgi:aspartate racemase